MPAIDPRPTIELPDDDPYLWLEELEGARALAWVEAQHAKTVSHFGSDASFLADRDALIVIFGRSDNIPYPTRRGGKLFNFWKDAAHPRGLWRTTSLESLRTDAPNWNVLLDIDALAEREGEDWALHGVTILPGPLERTILKMSRGGTDAVVMREFDNTTRAFVDDGFNLPEAKGGCAWLDRDTLLLSSGLGEGMATRTGHPRTVRVWRRGTDPLSAPVIFEIQPGSISTFAELDREAESERVVFVEAIKSHEGCVWIGDRTGAKTRIDVPLHAWTHWSRGWLVTSPRESWSVGGETYAPDTVLGISLESFLRGDRHFTRLWEPAPRIAVQGRSWACGRLVLSILDNLDPVIEVFTPSASGWTRERVVGLPEKGVVHVGRFDAQEEESNGDLLANVQTPLTPPSLYLLPSGKAPELLKRAPQAFNAEGLVVTRHEAVSTDGERIPYTQIGPPGETGEAPVHLYGYGGYRISQLPVYGPATGKLWLERGGTRVIAHIRGGGEFGVNWHLAGCRKGRQLAHDDFAAIAADLVRRGVTRPERIAAEGGSNGGTLIANMLTRYPERFGALFCTIPVIDLRRLKPLKTAWIDELGDPDKPEDWAYLSTMSAYHAAVPGKRYPPILLATNRRDDRVLPGHARKMAAKLQAMGYEAWYYEPGAGGHGYGKDHKETAAFMAIGVAFMKEKIGWT
jgi:prolyl oligopeptidase